LPTSHKKLLMAVPQIPEAAFINYCIGCLRHSVQNYSINEMIYLINQMVPNYRSELLTDFAKQADFFPTARNITY
jgi:hypothetical protein